MLFTCGIMAVTGEVGGPDCCGSIGIITSSRISSVITVDAGKTTPHLSLS